MKNSIEKITERTTVVRTPDARAFVFNISSSRHWDFNETRTSWESESTSVAGKEIIPWGENNDMPQVIRNIMDSNNLAPGIINREVGLLYGDGPALYRRVFTGGQMLREYDSDPKIEEWLGSWDFRRYVSMAMTEFKYMNGIFVKRYLSKGLRVPALKSYPIAKLEVVPSADARLAKPGSKSGLDYVKTIYEGDFENDCQGGITAYPVYSHSEPTKHKVSMSYHSAYSFGRRYYAIPIYYGALKWIMISSDIPEILKYLTDNSITAAYHIHSPAKYWEQKKEALKAKYSDPEHTEDFIDRELDKIKENLFKEISEVLTGKTNAGKFIDTVDFYDEEGNLCQWKIEAIEQKSKEFIEAQLKIGDRADSSTTSGMTLDPTLADIIVNGQLNSGSNKLYALMIYYASDVAIPEEVVFEAANQAIAVNFPGSDLRLGFYHRAVLKQQDITPDARVKNSSQQ